MDIDRKAVEVVSTDGVPFAAEFRLWDVSPVDGNCVRLELETANKLYVADADNYFDALVSIRTELERIELRPKCLGASENVYPSGMSRSMGVGDKAYRLTMGRPAMKKDIVDIFDVDSESQPASVKAQRQYFDKWLESFAN